MNKQKTDVLKKKIRNKGSTQSHNAHRINIYTFRVFVTLKIHLGKSSRQLFKRLNTFRHKNKNALKQSLKVKFIGI